MFVLPKHKSSTRNFVEQSLSLYRTMRARVHKEGFHVLGLMHLYGRKLQDAGNALQQALLRNPSDKNRLEVAIANLQKAQEFDHSEDMRHFQIGEVWRTLQYPNKALECYGKALAINPENSLIHNACGEVLLASGATHDAFAAFSASLNHDHCFDKALNNQAITASMLLRESMGGRLLPGDAVHEGASEPFTLEPAADYIYCPQYRFVYAVIPKAACTSFKALLYEIFKNDISALPVFAKESMKTRDTNFHHLINHGFSLRRYSRTEAEGILNSQQVFKFAFVRNPLERIVSGFYDKFVRIWPRVVLWRDGHLIVQKVPDQDCATRPCLTFRDFVDYVVGAQDMDLDRHWRPMHRLVDVAHMDFIGRLETMKDDFDYIRQRLDLPYNLPKLNSIAKKTLGGKRGAFADSSPQELLALKGCPPSELFYDSKLEAAIRERFKIDFETFGY